MLVDVVKVIATADFGLDLLYANGEQRRFDMRPLLIMKPWNKVAAPEIFKLARAEYGTVVWPGEIDIAPETLYEDSVPISERRSPRLKLATVDRKHNGTPS